MLINELLFLAVAMQKFAENFLIFIEKNLLQGGVGYSIFAQV